MPFTIMNELPSLIKSRIPLYEWVRKDVRLVRKGNHWMGLCPFHHEKTPSFSVNEQRFHCFGCQISGDLFEYVMQKKGLPFREALEELAAYARIPIPEKERPYKNLFTLLKKIQDCYHHNLLNHAYALAYLEKRQIHEESIKTFSLGFAASLRDFSKQDLQRLGFLTESGYDRFSGRLMFPIWDAYGQVVGFSGRSFSDDKTVPKYYNTPETEFFKKRTLLYAYHLAKRFITKDQPFILVEGYFDVITMHQYGIKTAIATMGTALSEENIQKLWRYQNIPILCFDGDQAGLRAAYKTIEKIIPFLTGKKTFHFYLLPEKEDPDTFLQKYGKEGFNGLKKYQMMDMLWHFIVSEQNLTFSPSPEQKAFFESSWKELLTPIHDSSLKRFYGQEFFKRQKELWTKKRKTDLTLKVPPIKDLDMRILLVTLINHPKIFDDVFESLSYVESQNMMLEKIKVDLLNKCELYESATLISETIYKWAPFAHPETSDEEALKGWTEVWERLVKKKAEDVQNAYQHAKEKCDAKSWEHFKTLKTFYAKKDRL